MSDADLSHVNFTGVNLAGANLAGARFTDSSLCSVNFLGADITGTDFVNVTMETVIFVDTTVSKANFAYADIQGICDERWRETIFEWKDVQEGDRVTIKRPDRLDFITKPLTLTATRPAASGGRGTLFLGDERMPHWMLNSYYIINIERQESAFLESLGA